MKDILAKIIKDDNELRKQVKKKKPRFSFSYGLL